MMLNKSVHVLKVQLSYRYSKCFKQIKKQKSYFNFVQNGYWYWPFSVLFNKYYLSYHNIRLIISLQLKLASTVKIINKYNWRLTESTHKITNTTKQSLLPTGKLETNEKNYNTYVSLAVNNKYTKLVQSSISNFQNK